MTGVESTAVQIREFVHGYHVQPHGQKALWSALERTQAAEREAHEAEVAKLSERVRELEGTNDALGEAIGLLHAMKEHQPDEAPTTTDPSAS